MKRLLLTFATLMILAATASAADRSEFNKMKYGREYLTAADQKTQAQKKAAPHKHAPAAKHACSMGCC